jgi:hypothetical protein
MLIRRIPYSEITPEGLYLDRRRFIKLASGLTILAASPKQSNQRWSFVFTYSIVFDHARCSSWVQS